MARSSLLAVSTATAALLLITIGCTNREPSSADASTPRRTEPVALGASATLHDAGGDDEILTLADCPASVQATIEAHLDGGALLEIERTTDHGEILYEVDVLAADSVVEFDVAEDGSFRGYEGADDDDAGAAESDDDEEREIPLAEVPDHVTAAAVAAVPGLVLEEASREFEEGAIVYELEGEALGVEHEIEVAADGTVLEIETDDEDGDDD